jgi:DNA topoisomerase-1
MANNLVIVESPAKSKTIEKYLGSDYVVTSSKGHIRDLTTRGYGGFGVDIENNFTPMYKNLRDKAEVVKELKKLVKNAKKVYLATDPDREGEAISYHLHEVLGLENKDYERIVFNEITKPAVLKAIDNGRDIDLDLVRSQESRRILDRIIGFSLSKLLQRKIGSKSAGRVQSVALKLIVDREKEVLAFIPEEYWEVFIEFEKKKHKLKAKLISDATGKVKLSNKEETDNVLSGLNSEFKIVEIVKKNRNKSAKAPFITSTLQQEASSKFNFLSKKTMMIAQRLYEGIELESERVGLITYMRTDSIRLSDEFVKEAEDFVKENYGNEYFGEATKKAKAKNVQDAHEAIRPSSLKYTPESLKSFLNNDEYKLYTLIYNRALSSLMSDAVVEDQKIRINNNDYIFEVNGTKVIFEGYLKVYSEIDNNDEKSLPEFKDDEILENVQVLPEQKFTSPQLRYSEARLIKKMEELGIGRPSTYSMTMETLKQRYYVKLDKKMFIPTEQGILTSDSLNEYFNSIINVKYTAEMENGLDEISLGKSVWYDQLKSFYDKFMPLVANADENMEKIYPVYVDEDCPECGSPLVKRNGRFGPFIACSGFPKCHYIKKEEKIEAIETDVKCPKCETGFLVEKYAYKGRSKGKKFYACNRYPDCKTTFSELPNETPQQE